MSFREAEANRGTLSQDNKSIYNVNQEKLGTPLYNDWSFIRQPPTQPILQSTNFTNNMSLLHNNIPQNILRSRIKEFTMIIDSADRDVVLYPNPFDFVVSIGPQVQNKIIEYIKDINDQIIIDPTTNAPFVNEKVLPIPGPVIKDPIYWLKYVRLDYAILPQSYTMDINSLKNNNYDIVSNDIDITKINLLDGDRCIQVHIPEINGSSISNKSVPGPLRYSTNDNLSESFAVLFDHTLINKNFFSSCNRGAGVDYNEPVKLLNKLTIKFKDSRGNQLKYPFLKSCECCNKKCDNNCCDPVRDGTSRFGYSNRLLKSKDSTAFGGCFAIDFMKVEQKFFHLNINVDLISNIVTGSHFKLEYRLNIINENNFTLEVIGMYYERELQLQGTFKRITTNTLEGMFRGLYDEVSIKGIIKFVTLENEISGYTKFSYGPQKIVIPFTLPLEITQTTITTHTRILVNIYPLSLITYFKLEYPVIDLDKKQDILRISIMIGNHIKVNGTFDKHKLIFKANIQGKIFNNKFNLTIDVINGIGSAVGMYEHEHVSLIIMYRNDSLSSKGDPKESVVRVIGKLGVIPIKLKYVSPVPLTLFNWMKIYGVIIDLISGNKIPICINAEKMDSNVIPKKNIVNIVNFDKNMVVNEMFRISDDNRYIGSYNYNNIDRKPMEQNVSHPERDLIEARNVSVSHPERDLTGAHGNNIYSNYSNPPRDIVAIVNNDNKNTIIGKIIGVPKDINFDFINKLMTQIDLTDNVTSTVYELKGTIQENFISLTDSKKLVSFCQIIKECEHDIAPTTYKSCCDCVISPKDYRLQNQLHIKLGIVIDDIPLIFSKQS
jgi:hypothetical protein